MSDPLGPNTVRNLCDKMYEKRKQGAQEVEMLVKELITSDDKERILSIVDYLILNFSTSPNGNHRKGALIALAAVAIALGTDSYPLLTKLVPPVIKSFSDPDSRVRYYACESMYNISKVARAKILPFFNEIFDGLFKLYSDTDQQVQKGAQLLDRLLKDIATEDESFPVDSFVLLLKDRLYVGNPFARQFLLGWIQVLDSVPQIEMLPYLPEFLDGIFNMVSDKKKEIRVAAENTLGEFLAEIQSEPSKTDFGSLVKILIPRCSSQDEVTKLLGLVWLSSFVTVGKEVLVPYVHTILGAVLPSVASESDEIREKAIQTNNLLSDLISSADKDVSIATLLQQISQQLRSDFVNTRLAALRWVSLLYDKYPQDLVDYLDTIFSTLLKMLSDTSEVVTLSLEVMARIGHNEEYFMKLMNSLISIFNKDPSLLEKKGTSVLRQLSLYIPPAKLYDALATLLEQPDYDSEFCSLMVQTLNLILLTSIEFAEMRNNLKDLLNNENKQLFIRLYKSWSHNPASTFSLCLIAEAYDHAYDLVCKFSELEITVNFLVEIDKLVQLIESPIFTGLRMQLLEPCTYPSLYKCLYGLLMLLPQSDAFETLKNRLNSVATLGQVYLLVQGHEIPKSVQSQSSINFTELSQHFLQVQKAHLNQNRKGVTPGR